MQRLESGVYRVGALSGKEKQKFYEFMVEVSQNKFGLKEADKLLSFPAGIVFYFRDPQKLYGSGVLVPLDCNLNRELNKANPYFSNDYIFGIPKYKFWELRFYSNGDFYEILEMLHNVTSESLGASTTKLHQNFSYDSYTFIQLLDFLVKERNVEVIAMKDSKKSKFLLRTLAKIGEENSFEGEMELRLTPPYQKGYNFLIFNS